MTSESSIAPDTKDWTWVLDRPCPECGFEADRVTADRIGEIVRDNATGWQAVLTVPDATLRPEPGTWSVLEYACHIRDVHRIFDERVAMMLEQDAPHFPNWDQDETAIQERYGEQLPEVVSADLLDAATAVADRYDAVPPGAWSRRGVRSNGSEFTVESLGRYHLHDVVHHLYDVRGAVVRATVESYDASAAAYRDGTADLPATVRSALDAFVAALPPGARVLEIGRGPGRDARELEAAGLSVRRTDVTPGFVELMRDDGYDADVLDPLTDDLADPLRPGTPYDAVWASASLLHVARADLPVVLGRLADATGPGGLLRLSVKEGDGEAWSTHGHVAGGRHFTFWREPALRVAVEAAGWVVEEVVRYDGRETGQPWLDVRATRRP